MIKWQPFWVFSGDESYDINSGLSFSILIYVLDTSGQFSPLKVSLYKPQVYGLWHCLWNNDKHIHQLTSGHVTNIVMLNRETMEFGLLPVESYFPFPHLFHVQPHCISHEKQQDILLHIDQSCCRFDFENENRFYTTFLHHHVYHVMSLFDILEDVVSIHASQKTTLITRWSRFILKDLIEDQDEEYAITV
jgi:hypothetical protein